MRSAASVLALALAGCDHDGGAPPMGASSESGDVADTTGEVGSSGADETTTGSTSSSSDGGESSTGEIPSAVPGRACPPDSFLDATNFGVPFFTTWCTGCHSSDLVGAAERQEAPPEYDFDSLEAIRAGILIVYLQAADDHVLMPPAGGPSAEERALLGDWLACGAP